MKNNWKQILKWILEILKWILIVIFVISVVVLTISLFFKIKICNIDIYSWVSPYIKNTNDLGTYGDFLGGVIGTILTFVSVIILARTFKQQKKVTEKNLKQQDIQRFNEMFFELLRLYREQVESLSLENKEVVYKGKEFFDKGKINITNKIEEQLNDQSDSLEIMVKALELYYDFYKENRSKLSTYYRTLYRIFEIIDKSKLIEEKEKVGYVKIVRAQLTESELFFIRYNAMSEYGRKSMQYLKKYRVLNHFPFYEMLEYRHLFETLPGEEFKENLNKIFNDIYVTAKLIIEGGEPKKEETTLSKKNDKHKIYINFLNKKSFR